MYVGSERKVDLQEWVGKNAVIVNTRSIQSICKKVHAFNHSGFVEGTRTVVIVRA